MMNSLFIDHLHHRFLWSFHRIRIRMVEHAVWSFIWCFVFIHFLVPAQDNYENYNYDSNNSCHYYDKSFCSNVTANIVILLALLPFDSFSFFYYCIIFQIIRAERTVTNNIISNLIFKGTQ